MAARHRHFSGDAVMAWRTYLQGAREPAEILPSPPQLCYDLA